MNRTPLYHAHETIGAKLVDFAGWEMPIQYSGVVDEYYAVRTRAGLFDVSHMGRIRVAGKGAAAFLQYVTTNDVSTLNVLESQYSMICNAEGGIKDDIFVYRLKTDEFLLCVNASNREKIVTWVQEQAARASEVQIADRSRELAQIALQGPAAPVILAGMEVTGLSALKPRCCLEASLLGVPMLITRTGYTGEVGFELYMPSTGAVRIWDELLARGQTDGLKPAGLGARDLLRLDMAYLLYGNDIGEDRTPLEAGAGWVVKLNKGPFIGSDALHRQQKEGLPRCLVGFELLQKAVPRHGFSILAEDGSVRTPIGEVTSGNLSPLLQKGIGLGYVPPSHAAIGTRMAIDIRGKVTPAVVVKPPFYKRKAG